MPDARRAYLDVIESSIISRLTPDVSRLTRRGKAPITATTNNSTSAPTSYPSAQMQALPDNYLYRPNTNLT